jgi:hypothetical protein
MIDLSNQILENRIYVNDIEFNRYYHKELPTRYFASKCGKIYSDIQNKILKPSTTVRGYYKVGIFIGSKKAQPVTVHKIVATVYCKSSYVNGYDVDHIDGNKLNNCAKNLEWVTRSINIKRAFKMNLKRAIRGDDHPITIYRDEQIHQLCKYLQDGMNIVDASFAVGIPKSYVYGMLNRHVPSRKHIFEQYIIPGTAYKTRPMPLTKDIKDRIHELLLIGYTPKEIKNELGITNRNQLYNIIYKKK